jgi:hypothetical protein
MDSTTLAPGYQEPRAAYPPLIIERFLRARSDVWRQIHQEQHLNRLLRQMLVSTIVTLGSYGAIIGMYHSPWQALSSAIKMPVLFLLTLAICLPTLYLFNLLLKGRMTVRQVLALALAAITVTSALTLAFVPITLFLMVTAPSYLYFLLPNVVILAITGAAGLYFLVHGTSSINALAQAERASTGRLTGAGEEEQGAIPEVEMLVASPAPPASAAQEQASKPQQQTQSPRSPEQVNSHLLTVWLLLYGFVGTQLAWTLRPFFAFPGSEFVLFREIEGNFYSSVITSILYLLSLLVQ